jgi:hypothetical protein
MMQCASFIRNLIPTPIPLSMFLRKAFKEKGMIGLSKGDNEIMKGFSAVGNNNSLPMENKQYGWICPVCGKGLAPWVSECSCVMSNTMNDISKRISYTEPMVGYRYNELNQFNSQTSGRPYNEEEHNEHLI